MAVTMWAIIGAVVVLLVTLHMHHDRRERAEGVEPAPRWWREAMDRWGGGFD